MIMAGILNAVGKPRDWDKAVSAAYLRLIGRSQEEAAKHAGVGERTLQRYEVSEWWPQACREAESRWLKGLVFISQQTLFKAIEAGDANLAFRVTERHIKALAPPSQRHEHSGPDGAPIETQHVHVYVPDNGRNRVSSNSGSNSNRASSRAPGSVSRNGR